jgi:hypothetical protein
MPLDEALKNTISQLGEADREELLALLQEQQQQRSSGARSNQEEIMVSGEVTKEVVDLVSNPNTYYNHYALNFVIEAAISQYPQARLIPFGENQNLAVNLQQFRDTAQTQAVIPIRPIDNEGQQIREHFAGIHIQRKEDGHYHASYIDPTGLGTSDNIPANIRDALTEILGIQQDEIIPTTNVIQKYKLHAVEGSEEPAIEITNVHCGAFVGRILSQLARGGSRVEGNRIEQFVNGGWKDCKDMSEDESRSFGEEIRRSDLELLTGREALEKPRTNSKDSSRSGDSGSDHDFDAITGNVRGRKGRIGSSGKEGDHTIPYSTMIEGFYAATKDVSTKDIPQTLNLIATSMGLGIICEERRSEAELGKINSLREERKSFTQNITGFIKSRESLTTLGELSEHITVDKTKWPNEEEASKAEGRIKRGVDLMSNFSPETFQAIKESLKTGEEEALGNLLSEVVEGFITKLNQRDGASHKKDRVGSQRAERQKLAQELVKLCVDEGFIPPLKLRGNQSEQRLDVIEFFTNPENQTKLNKIGLTTLTDIQSAVSNLNYVNRTSGEGKGVEYANYGIMAFNELLAISNEQNPEKKEQRINDLKEDKRLISGLVGTRVNPMFGVTNADIASNDPSNPLWNITRPEQRENLVGMCQNVGRLFDRILDFERGKVDNRLDQKELDANQVKDLYSATAETVVFVFQSFSQLKNLDQDLQTAIVTSFTENVVSNQGWGEFQIKEAGQKKSKPLSGEQLSEKCRERIGDGYVLRQEVRSDSKHNSQGKGGLSI